MEKNTYKNSWLNFFLRIILPSVLSISLFILTIFFIIIPRFKENILNEKRIMIRELTNSAWSILAKYENDERNGLLSREEAQNTAVSRIQYLRYGEEGKDYFWITDLHPNMVMHPYRSDLNKKDLNDFKDPHGKRLFVEFVKIVKEQEHGYVEYMWQWKDDSLKIVPKLSYVKLFKPWGWVIGTGIYIEDVQKEITALTRKLLWISIGISIIIAFMLLFISQQSLSIERKRILIENELSISKEKYRTLVEAATEGLIMILDGKISFSNNVISSMTGYENQELIDSSFSEIISDNNHKDIKDAFSEKIIKEGQYEINLKKKNGGFLEVLVTSSNAIFYNKAVSIIYIKDITIERKSNLSGLDYQKLITTLNIGFFRAKIDFKGKFIIANETAIRILGYDTFRDLQETHILEFLATTDDKKHLRNILIKNGFVKNKIIRIHKKNGESAIIAVSLVVYNNEDSNELICDGIIEDITLQETEKSETNTLIGKLKSSSFLIEQQVKDYVSPFHTISPDSSINEAIQLMDRKKTDNLLLTKDENEFIGIVTHSDIQKRVISLDLKLENPVYLIMSSPVVSILESNSIYHAINVCEEKNINHLVIKNESKSVTGILRINEIYKSIKNSLTFLNAAISKAETDDELKNAYKMLQLLVKPLIKSEISVEFITSITSAFSDTAIKRIIELTIKEIGQPPAGFSFVCLGSEGRKEETLYTDQDNAIIYEDVPAEKAVFAREYFNKLGEKVCNSLNYMGYAFCKGNIMAKNSRWCQPITEWEKYFANWITLPEPQNLLDASIFFDIRSIYGDDTITDRLRNTITQLLEGQSMFFYHLANNTFGIKPQQISSGSIISDKNADFIDLKSAVNLINMFARTYALRNNIWDANTFQRLNALKSKQIMNDSTVDEIIFIYNYLMKLRFRNQVVLMESNMPLSNTLNTKTLIEIELSILKKILSQMPVYQNKISVDFRLST